MTNHKHLKYFIKVWLIPAIIGILIAVFLRSNYFSFVRITGVSMEPNLVNNQITLLKKKARVSRGTVIVFKAARSQSANTGLDSLALRVIGLPGDKISFLRGHLLVNGKQVNESFLTAPEKAATSMSVDSGWSLNSLSLNSNWPKNQRNIKRVAKGTYFVLADNRLDPIDSRQYGLVKKTDVRGVLSVFPWAGKKIVKNVNHTSENFYR
ncbi:S26 family signal peptidase [Oenococcus sicerae]|uniref:signal peptidase I n=1 Tax=Oenococcus sicerae TaxID=2203724 RepID=UPI0010BB0844|nr:hypothetical protein OAL24_00327 [Oenococcus sicerae]